MNLSRCEQGHFFDKEKYATCPHCSGGAASDESLTTVFTEQATEPMAAAPAATPLPVAPEPAPMPIAPSLPIAGMSADQPTVALNMGIDTPTVPMQNNIDPFATSGETVEVTDDSDDHTVAFYDDVFNNAAPGTSPVTPAAPAAPAMPVNKVSTPCVGWLIAIGGAHIGTDFRLKVGKNFIGRNASMDIALTEDKSVSREKHAIVVYEPKQHLYLVQPGEASSLVYRNNQVVLSPVELEAYDMITVGDVNLLFMPLCGARFNWSDLLEEMNKNK